LAPPLHPAMGAIRRRAACGRASDPHSGTDIISSRGTTALGPSSAPPSTRPFRLSRIIVVAVASPPPPPCLVSFLGRAGSWGSLWRTALAGCFGGGLPPRPSSSSSNASTSTGQHHQPDALIASTPGAAIRVMVLVREGVGFFFFLSGHRNNFASDPLSPRLPPLPVHQHHRQPNATATKRTLAARLPTTSSDDPPPLTPAPKRGQPRVYMPGHVCCCLDRRLADELYLLSARRLLLLVPPHPESYCSQRSTPGPSGPPSQQQGRL
jgi:hypothetical protein